MSDQNEDKAMQFAFSEEQLKDWLNELDEWAKKHQLNPQELCVVLGFLHEWLKEDLGIEIIHKEFGEEETPEDMH